MAFRTMCLAVIVGCGDDGDEVGSDYAYDGSDNEVRVLACPTDRSVVCDRMVSGSQDACLLVH